MALFSKEIHANMDKEAVQLLRSWTKVVDGKSRNLGRVLTKLVYQEEARRQNQTSAGAGTAKPQER